MIGISSAYEAWCLDEACAEWGAAVEEAMEKATKSSKKSKMTDEQRQARADNAMRKMLGEQPKFRDISELMKG